MPLTYQSYGIGPPTFGPAAGRLTLTTTNGGTGYAHAPVGGRLTGRVRALVNRGTLSGVSMGLFCLAVGTGNTDNRFAFWKSPLLGGSWVFGSRNPSTSGDGTIIKGPGGFAFATSTDYAMELEWEEDQGGSGFIVIRGRLGTATDFSGMTTVFERTLNSYAAPMADHAGLWGNHSGVAGSMFWDDYSLFGAAA